MLGTLANTAAVLVGSAIGLLLNKGLPAKYTDGAMKAIAIFTLYVGISGSLAGQNAIVAMISLVVGTLIGTLLNLDGRLSAFGESIGKRFPRKDGSASVAEGFVAACLLFCIGSMTVVGSIQSGLTGDHSMIYTKSAMDFVSAIVLASTLGAGVMLSAAFVLVFQGGIVLLAQWIAPFLSDYMVAEMTCVGSLLIIALGLNLLGVTKLKVINGIIAIFLPLLICLFIK
ncbi:MAG: DUF554 domain-containing protein [Clostridiales bacterium]|nr:DUF554 domain-containing protein [Clostridiales bacterium]